MRSPLKYFLATIFAASSLLADAPHYRVNVDFQKPNEPFKAFAYQSSESYYDFYFYANGVPYTNLSTVVFAYRPFANNKNLISATQVSSASNCAIMYLASTNVYWPTLMAPAQLSITNGGVRTDFASGYMTVQQSILHMNPPAYPPYNFLAWLSNSIPLGSGLVWTNGTIAVLGGLVDDLSWMTSKLDTSFTNSVLTTNSPDGITIIYSGGKLSAVAAGVAWGAITGTITNQTDLNDALNGKYPNSNPSNYCTLVR